MKTIPLTLLFLLHFGLLAFSQAYHPVLEPAVCPIKTDPRLVVKYGYLVVPENRQRPHGRKVKIPYLFVRRPDQDARRRVSLFTTGGPGYSTTANIDSIGYQSGLLKYGGTILFDQRGTKRAQPCLDCPGVEEAIKRSYRTGLNQDSLTRLAVKACRQNFTRQGIDLSAYNTLESAEDINDLRLALQLDSLNLIGISYSGGLMLTVARTHPEAVRSLLLNSPLPGYVRYEEDGLLNINEALEQVFSDATAADPARAALRSRFHAYFTSITGKKFTLNYLEKDTRDSLRITYTKQELLDAVVNRLNSTQVHTLPVVIDDLVQGRHRAYVREVLDATFAGDPALSLGMRYSVYCSEQIAYANPAVEKQQHQVLPWLAGYGFNNVNHALCACWNVKPEPPAVKDPVYSAVPALVAAGDLDPLCRPFYNQLIKRYLPNAQLLLLHNQGHGPSYTVDGIDYVERFLAHPYQRLMSTSKDLRIE
ncbi:alpha/beta hydrolase [Hymenobacter crusticola]|uniref:Proline iminopeptidase n=1 Tax=Hymenobacter crusticola TaxID=1770526 RepID=A0A243W529_9BACT|nr:alpha/beta fold hydrolase [Hymenobacter crusticola]OUJ67773.1 alpha/beta hydrolase [Hymenobacter crusticola]